MKRITSRDERRVSEVIEAVGRLARQQIGDLPDHVQDLAWMAVASAIVGAAIHDSTEPWKVVDMVSAVFVAMISVEDFEKAEAALELQRLRQH